MRGWTPDGREVELMAHQETWVRKLLSRKPEKLPARGYGAGWSTALHTAARYDRGRRSGDPLPGDPELTEAGYADDPGDFAGRDRACRPSVRSWYDKALSRPPRPESPDAGEDHRPDRP